MKKLLTTALATAVLMSAAHAQDPVVAEDDDPCLTSCGDKLAPVFVVSDVFTPGHGDVVLGS